MDWAAVGIHAAKILVAGYNETKNGLEYMLVDAATLTPFDRLSVTEKAGDFEKSAVAYIKMTNIDDRLVAVCCRTEQYIDILEVNGDRLSAASRNRAVDVCGDKEDKYISSICQHASRSNVILLGGYQWLKKLEIQTD